MNLIAAELKVPDLRRAPKIFTQLDTDQTGLLTPVQFGSALGELGVMQQHSISQVINALDDKRSGSIAYGLFMAGCIDLVEDKLDHMLWKVFSMVDEDHSS